MLFSHLFLLGCLALCSGSTDVLKILLASENGEFTIGLIEEGNPHVSLTTITHDNTCPLNLTIPPYCSQNCGSTTSNRLDLKTDTHWFLFTDGYLVVFSGINETVHGRTKVRCLRLPQCRPLATYHVQLGGTPNVYVHCAGSGDQGQAVRVLRLQLTLGRERYTAQFCSKPLAQPNGASAAFFSDAGGNVHLAYTTTQGVSFCDFVDDVDAPLPNLENCPFAVQISRFDSHTLLFECASDASFSIVTAAYTFSIDRQRFMHSPPGVPSYHLNHLVFSANKLYCARFWEKDCMWMNLTQGSANLPTAFIATSSDIVSAHLLTTGSALTVVLGTLLGAFVYDSVTDKLHKLSPFGSGGPPTGNSLHVDVADGKYVGFESEKFKIEISNLKAPESPPTNVTVSSNVGRFRLLVLPPANSPTPLPNSRVYDGTIIGSVVGVALAVVCAVVVAAAMVVVYLVKSQKIPCIRRRWKNLQRRRGRGGYRKMSASTSSESNVMLIASNETTDTPGSSRDTVPSDETNLPGIEVKASGGQTPPDPPSSSSSPSSSPSSSDRQTSPSNDGPVQGTAQVEIHPHNPEIHSRSPEIHPCNPDPTAGSSLSGSPVMEESSPRGSPAVMTQPQVTHGLGGAQPLTTVETTGTPASSSSSGPHLSETSTQTASNPTNPTGNPQAISTGDPQAISTGDPQAISTGDPQAISTGDPQAISTGDPQAISTGDPQAISTGNPQAISTGNPQAISTGNPQAISTGNPQAISSGNRQQLQLVGSPSEEEGSPEPSTTGVPPQPDRHSLAFLPGRTSILSGGGGGSEAAATLLHSSTERSSDPADPSLSSAAGIEDGQPHAGEMVVSMVRLQFSPGPAIEDRSNGDGESL